MSETGNEVWQRLTSPQETISFNGLALRWQCQDIIMNIKGYGRLADIPELLPMLRGAIGRSLMDGASQESLNQEMCLWTPPCANDVFYGPKPGIKVTRHTHDIPKPFILSAKEQGQGLLLVISLFGFAREWQSDMRSALLNAVRGKIDWGQLAGDLFVPAVLDIDVKVQEKTLQHYEDIPCSVIMDFITPIDCKNTDPADKPESVLSRLAHRMFLLARWHGVHIDADWRALSSAWRAVISDVETLKIQTLVRNSKRTKSQYTVYGRLVRLTLEGDLAPIWPLLLMGEHAHVGRGTTAGLGRYQLQIP